MKGASESLRSEAITPARYDDGDAITPHDIWSLALFLGDRRKNRNLQPFDFIGRRLSCACFVINVDATGERVP